MNILKKGFTSFQLKIIALVIMTVDHIGAYKLLTQSAEINIYLRITGRIAAPIFLFLLVEGLRYTRDRKKYILRLYIAGVLTQTAREFLGITMGNIFQTFFYAALYIACIDIIIKKDGRYKVPAAVFMISASLFFLLPNQPVLRIFFPSLLTVEYTFIFVLLAAGWYFINDKFKNCVLFTVLSVSCIFFWGVQWFMILAVPFMLLYNGEKGRSGLKYLFYIYYPAHQILFYLLS